MEVRGVTSGRNSAYAELVTATNFSFLRGASHSFEMVAQAAGLGLSGIDICDRNSLSVVVRAYSAWKDIREDYLGFRLVVGTRLVFSDGLPDVAVYPQDRAGYGRLSALLTLGNRRAPKGSCDLGLQDLVDHADGQLMIVLPRDESLEQDVGVASLIHGDATGRVWVAAAPRLGGHDTARLNRIASNSAAHGLPMLATTDALFHEPGRKSIQDVLTCIREHVTIEEAGFRLAANAERHIKSPEEMMRLFSGHPGAIAETGRFLEKITFTLDQLKYIYPEETVDNGETAQQTLERLAYGGAQTRYLHSIPDKVQKGLAHELALIAEMKYAPYFLTVADIVRFARQERGILCQGRGSAANSAVCFCLGITEVDPMLVDLLFERFVSTERDEPPDIDVDFEHERREEVMQYTYQKYGRSRAGLTATVTTYRGKGAKAADQFHTKTSRPNQMWQTDFTYFKIIGWGWMYLSTMLDDYSRYIIAWKLCSTMRAQDVADTLDMALTASSCDQAHVQHRLRLLSDNGPSYIAQDLADYIQANGMDHVRAAPMHPQTQGKIERWHQTLKNRILLENYFLPGDLESQIEAFIEHHNHRRYHESLENVTPADAYFGRAEAIIKHRERIKRKTIEHRRLLHASIAA